MAQKQFNALLFDTRSIQRYIFSGNRLRTNVGASYIVDKLFFDVLINGVLKKMFPDEKFPAGDDAWNPDNDNATPWTEMKSCCVAYIGGGNALLLFRREDDSSRADIRVEVVKNFTRKLLVARPGLKVGAALGTLEVDSNDKLVQKTIDELYRELKSNQNKIFPVVNVPYSGLTLCDANGETANFFGRLGIGDANFYSQETAVKSKLFVEAKENLRSRFDKIFSRKGKPEYDFDFPSEIDELGQREGENYFAIVHVDGNNMGLKFRTCTGLDERRKLSREIRRKTEGAFADLLEKIIRMKNSGGFDKILDVRKNFLPIRPLIIGGDDVTFLCPANMAIMFTKTLIERLDADTPENSAEHLTEKISQHMDACAGIAILPTKYPFFRGYELAEQLCDSAKKEMRKLLPAGLDTKENLTADDIPRGSSWLDFAILHGEQAPTLEQIRATEYRGALGNLHFGPYRLCNATNDAHNLENLISCTTQFLASKKKKPPPKTMAHNKIKELRSILQRGTDDAKKFLRQLRYQNQDLPDVQDWEMFSENLWYEKKTPYVDAIELMDFYVEEVARTWQDLTQCQNLT